MKGKEIYLGHGLYMYIHKKSIIDDLGKSINASHPTKRKPITKEQVLKGPDKQEKGVESKHEDKIFKNAEKLFFKGEKWVWKI